MNPDNVMMDYNRIKQHLNMFNQLKWSGGADQLINMHEFDVFKWLK